MKTSVIFKLFVLIAMSASNFAFAGAGVGRVPGKTSLTASGFGLDQGVGGGSGGVDMPQNVLKGAGFGSGRDSIGGYNRWAPTQGTFDAQKNFKDALENFKKNSERDLKVENTQLPTVDAKVLFIQKQHSELVYDVAVPGEKEVIRLNQRPEEFTGLEGQRVFDALRKSSATKQWVDVPQAMDLYKMNSQQGN